MTRAVRSVLVANRGEIAVRIIRTLRDLGLRAIAVYSEADAGARHVELADEAVCVGPGPSARSYLNAQALIDAARATGVDAIHPGYGFLSERASFVEACEAAGLCFIGPSADNMRLAGSKLGARAAMQAAGVPVIPGSQQPLSDAAMAASVAGDVGYPLMLKASAGGGGRGMRVVTSPVALEEEFPLAQGEARTAFGDSTLYLERLIEGARHIEVLVLGDGRGNAVHLGERNCSIQRRHQKMLEEAPSPGLSRDVAGRLHAAACRAVTALKYRNAGTVEFLLDADNNFYFMEINARIQVEHPVTEEITSTDLIRAQIEIASTGALPFGQDAVQFRGHAIECRINAEDPASGFMPQPGLVERLRLPGGPGVRVDSHLYQGYTVPVYYDSLIGKIIAHGATRADAVARMDRALAEFDAQPLKTTAPFLRQLLHEPAFADGSYTLAFLPSLLPPDDDEDDEDA
jgi:acetyl-CoA carboxylase, biotin carboxylase subunit